ncbi:MAG: anthranilate phosphoribosyltransferase [Acidimicrobiia bacterium]|nr:anthranilate phosphoribosyltransferase [Acidimicrobiia bacterium]
MSEFNWSDVVSDLVDGQDLGRDRAQAAMNEIMEGRAGEAQIAGFVVALRSKGESVEEMAGLVDGMYAAAVTVDAGDDVVDLVGTGGDRAGTFNISTTAALVAAGAGVKIAKHGNRAASSKTGSADLLEQLGIRLDLPPEGTVAMIREIGFGFFFAPAYHPAMRFAGPVRRQLGIRTVFNFLGPLCNPAKTKRAAIGVSDPVMAERMAGVMAARGAEYAFVFYGHGGLDELSTAGISTVHRVRHGEITTAQFQPSDFGVPRSTIDQIQGGDSVENERITRSVIEGDPGPQRDVTVINAAPAIVVAGLADGFEDGILLAQQAIDSGAAAAVLERAINFSAQYPDS